MFLESFKVTETSPDLQAFLIELIENAYNKSIKKESEYQVNELCLLRRKIENINLFFKDLVDDSPITRKLLEVKEDLINYGNYINKLIKKIQLLLNYEKRNLFSNFDNYFTYFDNLTGQTFKEGLFVESLMTLYNLSIVYYRLASNLKNKIFELKGFKDDPIKESMKLFQFAAAGFKLLKENVKYYNSKLFLFPNDYNESILHFKYSLCLTEVQSMVFHLAEAKNLDLGLQASLAKATSDMFINLQDYTKFDPFKKFCNLQLEKICTYYSSLYLAITYELISDQCLLKFKETGIDFSHTITYLNAAVASLNNGSHIFSMLHLLPIINYKEFYGYKQYSISQKLKLRQNENETLWHKAVIDIQYLPKIEALKKIKEIDFPDDIENKLPNLFNMLEPVQHTELVNKFKQGFINLLEIKLSTYCNDKSMKDFQDDILNSRLGEFKSLVNSAFGNSNQIYTNSLLYKKIIEFQKRGGDKVLLDIISKLNSNYKDLTNRCNRLKQAIKDEENIDKKQRDKFLTDEKALLYKLNYNEIKPSIDVNGPYYSALNKIESQNNMANEVDLKIIVRIEQAMKGYTILIPSNTKGISCLSFMSQNSIENINNIINDMDLSNEKKKQAQAIFSEIPEWKLLNGSIHKFRHILNEIHTLKDKIRVKANNFSDIDLSQLINTNDFSAILERKANDIFESKDFKDSIAHLKILDSDIEATKNEILRLSDELRNIIVEKDLSEDSISNKKSIREQFTLNKKLFQYENVDLERFFTSIEYSLNEFFEIIKLVNYSDSFYYQQNIKVKDLHIKINKFLIDRSFQSDNFINKYNNNGIMIKSIGLTQTAMKLYQEIEQLEQLAKDEGFLNSATNKVTNLNINIDSKK